MDYYLIKGHFHVVGYSPDGDSLMFEAENPRLWDQIQSEFTQEFQEKLEKGEGSVQLRLQGIDALETHYSTFMIPPPSDVRGKKSKKAEMPKPRKLKQPELYGKEATNKLLSYLGVDAMEWGSGFASHVVKEIMIKKGRRKTTFSEKGKDRTEGYVVVNDFDRKGRPISWVFGGRTRYKDGAKLTTSKIRDRIKKSGNYRLVAAGLVYPYFFMTLSAELRAPLIHGVKNAQRQKMKLWSEDKTQKGIKLKGLSQLTDKYLIFPYLFRRMVKHQFKYMMEDYWEALRKNKKYKPDTEELYLDHFFADTNPYVFLIDELDFRRLDEVVHIDGKRFKLNTHPGNIVFLS